MCDERVLRLDLDELEKWLGTFSDTEVVGYTYNNCDCPLARFFTSKLKEPCKVSSTKVAIGDGFALAGEVLQHFVKEVDCRSYFNQRQTPITKKLAMGCLQGTRRKFVNAH